MCVEGPTPAATPIEDYEGPPLPDSLEDLEPLVRRAQRRDPQAFSELIRRFERTALALALSGTQDPHAAGDVVQDAFVRAWERLNTLNDPTRFAPWLANIVRNLAADFRRSGKRLRMRQDMETVEPNLLSHADPASLLTLDESRSAIQRALQSLDEVSRSAVVLRYYEGMTSKQIASLLDMTPAAIDMRLMRARDQLRQTLLHLHEPCETHEPEEPVASLIQSRMGGSL